MTKLAHRHSRLGGLHRANNLSAKKAVVETAAKKISTNGCDGLPESMTCMTASSENQKEAATMTAEVLNVKQRQQLVFAMVVQIMYGAGKLAQITREKRCCGLHILGVSESRL